MNAKEKLRELVFAGATQRWTSVTGDVAERLDFELEVFDRCGAVEYMLMCADIVETIMKAGGYIGPGRGSGVGSAVCYALGVSNVDPLKYDLLFERFMRPDRIMSPSVCIDTDYRGDVVARELLVKKYGAILEPERRKGIAWPNSYRIGQDGWIAVTGTPEVERIKETVALIDECRNAQLRLMAIPDDDWDALGFFWRGETDGIPFFDSPNMKRTLCRALGPRFRDLVALFALSKPGLTDYREQYIAARQGRVQYSHPLLKNVLEETYGILLYQEQVMLVSRVLAGFSRSESDRLAKAVRLRQNDMLDGLASRFVAGCLENTAFRVGDFTDEANAMKCSKAIWEMLCHAGSFSWQKAHCVAWTMVAYQLAYLKAHYPSQWTYGMEKTALRQVTMVKDEKRGPNLSLHDIKIAIEDGCNVTLFVPNAGFSSDSSREASPDERLPITDCGRERARQFGADLARIVDASAVSLWPNGTLGAIQTAYGIRDGLLSVTDGQTPTIPVRVKESNNRFDGALLDVNDWYERMSILHGASKGLSIVVESGLRHSGRDTVVVITSPYMEVTCGVLESEETIK